MPFTDVFGGNTIYPASPSILPLSLTADVTLQWPLDQEMGGNILAAIIVATPNAAGRVITLPDARQGSTGYVSTFYNSGADPYTVEDALGVTVLSVGSGEAWTVVLLTNATAGGTWLIFEAGAGTSTANAATLAGAGLEADGTTLNEEMINSNHAVDYVLVDADRATVQTWTGGIGTFTLPNPATVGAGWFVPVKNTGNGSLTITPAVGSIDQGASLILSPLDSAFIYTDGTDYFTVGFGQDQNSVFDFLSMSVAGTGDLVLSGSQLNRVAYEFTGILTGNRNIIVPATVQQYWVYNNTTGAFTLTVKTALGTGVQVPQGTRIILYCDGTNVVNAQTNTASLPAVVQGDLLYGISAGVLAALPKSSTDNRVLGNGGSSNNPAWQAPFFSAAMVKATGTTALPDGTPTVISWDNEILDVGGWHDSFTNPSRLTVPSGVSRVRVEAIATVSLSNAGVPYNLSVAINKNGGTGPGPLVLQHIPSLPGTLTIAVQTTTGWVSVIPGDYFEMSVTADGNATGGTLTTAAIFSIEGRV